MEVPWKVILAFVGTFIAGAVFGGVFTVGVSARRLTNAPRAALAEAQPITQLPPAKQPPPASVAGPHTPKQAGPAVRVNQMTPTLMKQLTRRLNPSPQQEEDFRKIVGRAGEDLARLRQQNFADVARVMERMYADVSAVLTMEQRSELEKMRKQNEEQLREGSRSRAEAAAVEAQNRGKAAPGGSRPAAVQPPPP